MVVATSAKAIAVSAFVISIATATVLFATAGFVSVIFQSAVQLAILAMTLAVKKRSLKAPSVVAATFLNVVTLALPVGEPAASQYADVLRLVITAVKVASLVSTVLKSPVRL